ncbi:hypothetical protein [Nocardia terpenica]|uniref:hypothetical protein n=1 Tax=Nocardia terpenica TaxID=455432 RepID=UPI003A5C23CC
MADAADVAVTTLFKHFLSKEARALRHKRFHLDARCHRGTPTVQVDRGTAVTDGAAQPAENIEVPEAQQIPITIIPGVAVEARAIRRQAIGQGCRGVGSTRPRLRK